VLQSLLDHCFQPMQNLPICCYVLFELNYQFCNHPKTVELNFPRSRVRTNFNTITNDITLPIWEFYKPLCGSGQTQNHQHQLLHWDANTVISNMTTFSNSTGPYHRVFPNYTFIQNSHIRIKGIISNYSFRTNVASILAPLQIVAVGSITAVGWMSTANNGVGGAKVLKLVT
jgi:hypothetical protein